MPQQKKNVLISLDARHADSVISGKKTVELRNRRMNLSKGDTVWVYSKRPRACISMRATVKAIVEDNPKSLWKDFHEVCGISKNEFFAYFGDAKVGYAISLSKITRLSSPPTLEIMRKTDKNFHPPQFSKHLDGIPLLSFLEDHLAKA